jgi:hypothetical protein
MPKLNQHRRLRCENVDLTLGDGGHKLEVSLAYDSNNVLRELVFVGRGKIGHGIDALLHELGIKVSRIIQGRHPETGE